MVAEETREAALKAEREAAERAAEAAEREAAGGAPAHGEGVDGEPSTSGAGGMGGGGGFSSAIDAKARAELNERLDDPLYSEMLVLVAAEGSFLVSPAARAEAVLAGGPGGLLSLEGQRALQCATLEALGVTNGELFDRLAAQLSARPAARGAMGAGAGGMTMRQSLRQQSMRERDPGGGVGRGVASTAESVYGGFGGMGPYGAGASVRAVSRVDSGATQGGRSALHHGGHGGSDDGGSDASSSGHSEPDEPELHLELVSPADAPAALKRFVELHGNDARAASGAARRGGPAGAAGRVAVLTKRQAEREREYWKNLSEVVSDRGRRAWLALERGLKSYHEILRKRAADLAEVDDLGRQNGELRELLGQYLSSSVNDQLQIPPAHVL